jgi:hypothetical protein
MDSTFENIPFQPGNDPVSVFEKAFSFADELRGVIDRLHKLRNIAEDEGNSEKLIDIYRQLEAAEADQIAALEEVALLARLTLSHEVEEPAPAAPVIKNQATLEPVFSLSPKRPVERPSSYKSRHREKYKASAEEKSQENTELNSSTDPIKASDTLNEPISMEAGLTERSARVGKTALKSPNDSVSAVKFRPLVVAAGRLEGREQSDSPLPKLVDYFLGKTDINDLEPFTNKERVIAVHAVIEIPEGQKPSDWEQILFQKQVELRDYSVAR